MARKCRTCSEPLPADATKSRKYCNDNCRVNFHRRVKAALAEGGKGSVVPEETKRMRELALANLGDEVREVLRDEVRASISQFVKDNVLGAAEVIALEALPKALKRIIEDLDDEDWMVHSRAAALVMKYSLEFGKADPNDKGSPNIMIVSGVPLPDTPLGEAVAAERGIDVIDAEVVPALEAPDHIDLEAAPRVEKFEEDWPECYYCHHRVHPANVRVDAAGVKDTPRTICTSCTIRREWQKKRSGGSTDILDDRLFLG